MKSPSSGEKASRRTAVEVIGLPRRLLAGLVDALFMIFLNFALVAAIGFLSMLFASGNPNEPVPFSRLAAITGIVLSLLYFVASWMRSGQTIGKMTLGLKVVDSDGGKLGLGQALLRYVGYIVSSLIASLGFLWIAYDGKHQGWHDKIARSYVVDVDEDFAMAKPPAFVARGERPSWLWLLLWLLLALVAPFSLAFGLIMLGPQVDRMITNWLSGLF